MTPEETLRLALVEDRFPEDEETDRLFTPSGEDKLRLNRNIALSAWMSRTVGRDINAGSITWQADKDAIAQGFFKIPTASKISDEQFHGLVRSHVQTADEAADIAARYALQGKGLVEAMADLNAKRGPSQLRNIWNKYSVDLAKRHSVLTNRLAPYRPLIQQVSAELSKEMEWALPTTDTFQRVADKLMQVPEGDRRLVLSAIGATGGMDAKERSSYLSKLAGAMGRMTETMGSAVASSVAEAAMPGTIADLVEAGQMEMAGRMEKESERQRQMTILTQQIRSVADQEIAPIKEDGWWKGLGIDLARMIPQSAVSVVNPALGFGANWAYFKDTVAAQAMMEDPALSVEQAEGIANATAPLNAAVETVTALIPFGKVRLPFLQKWIQATTTSLGGAARNLAIRSSAATASEIGEEWMQSYLPLKAQELAAALSQDVPGVDWEKRMPKFSEIAAQTWGPALVFSLVGGGAASISEVRSGRDLAQDVDAMVATGMNPDIAAKISEAAKANDWQTTDALFREEFVSDTKATEEERKGAFARFQQKQEEMRRIQARDTAEAEAIGVAVIRDAEGWKVRLSDGSVIPADSAEAATRMQKDMAMAASEYEAETMVAAVDEMLKQQPTRRFEITAEVAQAGDNGLVFTNPITGQVREIKDEASLQNLRDEQMALAKKEGEEPAAALILGMNRFEFGNGIISVFQRGLNKDGTADVPRIITAMHEQIEASWRKGVALGKFTEQESRNAVAVLISQLDPKRLGKRATQEELNWFDRASRVAKGEGDENLLREVISELAVRTWIGRDKTGERTGMTPGTILRALDSAVLTARKPAEMSMFRRIRSWFKAVGAYLRGVVATAKIISQAEQNGTVGDFTEFMDKLLGLTEQTREDAAQADQIRQQMEADGMAFSLPSSRATPTTVAPVVRMPDGAQLIGPSTFSITAYHGTPHKVDKFTTSKIGTGEGAQAYGWGLYFAQERKVAEEYKASVTAKLSKNTSFLTWGIYGSGENFWIENGDLDRRGPFKTRAAAESALLEVMGEKGNLYTVELLPDADEFLDWDKPLNEQPQTVRKFAAKHGIPADYQGNIYRALHESFIKSGKPEPAAIKEQKLTKEMAKAGIPGIRYLDHGSRSTGDGTRNYVIFDENLVRILEENGKPVGSTFSLSPTSSAEQLANIIESIMQARPELAFKIRQRSLSDINRLIQNWSAERVTWKGDKIRPVVEKRTKASLDKEQAMREAVRYSELLDNGMATLTPETLMAWSEGVGKLEQHPLIRQMLGAHGRLMSKSTAESLGKLKTDGKGKAGDYDGAGWLPPQWYSGSAGGIMPDVMAQNLYDDGLLNEPTPDALWQALDSVVTMHRAAKAEYAKAEVAVKSVENQAKEKAKAETAAWRQETEDMMADDWSPRESLQRDARLFNTAMAAFPAEIRAKIVPGGMVKIAGLATERARYKVIEKAMQKAVVELEKFMRKEITAEVDKLLERYSPQKDKSGRITGKLLADYTELIGYADFIKSASIEDQAKESDALEKAIENGESAEIVQDALNKIGVLRLFETWDTKDSIAQSAALDWINGIIAEGKLGKKILDEERKAFLDDLRGNATADILEGAEVSLTEANNITNAVQSSVWRKLVQNMRGMVNSMLLNTAQRLESIFGENSKVTDYFVPKLIEAANRSTDIKRDIDRKRRDALTVVFNTSSTLAHARGIARLQKPKQSGIFVTEGRKTEEVKLDIDTLTKLSDGTMTAEAAGLRQDQVDSALEEWASSDRKRTVTVEKVLNAGTQRELFTSEMKGIQWLLWSRQDASRAQMERDGWTDESFKQLDEFLSPEAKLLADWMASSYAEAPRLIDPVYRRLFNAPLPRVKNYAPIYRHRQGEANILDLDGSDVSSGLAAGFTKSRVNTVSPLMELDAMAVFLAHWENVAHWVSHAEVMRDARAVLLDSKTRTAIRQKKGDASLKNLQEDVTKIEGNGTDKARELVFLSGFWNNLMQYRAFKGLAWRISPVVKQASAVLNPLLADVPAHAYAIGLARAFTDPVGFSQNVAAMWKSDIIRRRVEGGFSAEARIAMQGQGMNSSMLLAMMQKGMMPMAEMDAGWTALGAAISFDYYRRSYIKENPGTTAELADAYASKQLDRMIATSAQPADLVNRALIERSSNRFMKALWMFASESRKALAIEVMAIRRLATGRSKNKLLDLQRVAVAHVLQAAVTQLSTAILASMIGDDEDEEREWSQEQWASSLALGPIGGLFVFGRAIEMGVDRLLGLRVFRDSGMIDKAMEDVYRGVKNFDDLFSDDPDDVTAEIDRLSTATGAVLSGLFGPAGGAADVMGNIAREAKKVSDAVQRE